MIYDDKTGHTYKMHTLYLFACVLSSFSTTNRNEKLLSAETYFSNVFFESCNSKNHKTLNTRKTNFSKERVEIIEMFIGEFDRRRLNKVHVTRRKSAISRRWTLSDISKKRPVWYLAIKMTRRVIQLFGHALNQRCCPFFLRFR